MALLNGLEISVSHHLPKEYIGNEVYSFVGHPLYRWVYRLIFRREPLPTWHRWKPIYRETAIVVGNKLIVPPSYFREISTQIYARQSFLFNAPTPSPSK